MSFAYPTPTLPKPARRLRSLITIALASAAALAFAGITTPAATVVVSPPVAAPGVSRTVTVNVVWPDACPPAEAIAAPTPRGRPDVLVIRLNEPATFAPCAQVQTPITREVVYTPLLSGELPVRVTSGMGVPLGEGTLVTRDDREPHPLAGVWLGNADEFAMLQLTATADGRSDGVVGSLNLFGRDSLPRWRLLHSSGESAPGVVQASLSALTGSPAAGCSGPACPAAQFSGSVEAVIEIEAAGSDRIRVTVSAPAARSETPLVWYRSYMTRVRL